MVDIKYLCIVESTDNINMCLREDEDKYYIDINKNNTYVNLCSKDKKELIIPTNINNEQLYLYLLNYIITQHFINVKFEGF